MGPITRNQQRMLTEHLSEKDGKKYTSVKVLKFAREALCFMGKGCQRVVATENAKEILRHLGNGAFGQLPS